MPSPVRVLVAVSLSLASPSITSADVPGVSSLPAVALQRFATLYEVTNIASARDGSGRLFLTTRPGQVFVWNGAQLLPTPFLDLTGVMPPPPDWEDGLLGLAFHPQYATNGFFFINYTNAAHDLVVARYRVSAGNPNLADPASAQVILTTTHGGYRHFAGQLQFGPEGYLYVAIGDAGTDASASHPSQRLDSRLGKLLRIDVDHGLPYTVPPTNPFVGVPGALPEIWSRGLRNPWRFSFDRQTGDLLLADVGEDAWEEIDFQPAQTGGRNYGWPLMEGTHCYLPATGCNDGTLILPIWEYAHFGSCTSVTGGYRYRGAGMPGFGGVYVLGDACRGFIEALELGPGTATPTTLFYLQNAGFSTFGEDESGELYVADLNGPIYKLVAGRDLSVSLTDSQDPVVTGTLFSYQVSVTSGPSSSSSGFVVTATLPAGLTFAGTEPPTLGCSEASGEVTCPLTGPGTFAIRVLASPATSGTFTGVVHVAGDDPDPRPQDNVATVTTTVIPSPISDLSVVLSDDADPLAAGGEIVYRLSVYNAGPFPAHQAGARLTLPRNLVARTASNGCVQGGGAVTCTAPLLSVGQWAGWLVYVPSDTTYGTAVARATTDADEADPNPANDAAVETTTIGFLKGDVNADLKTDIVLQNRLNGSAEVWLMRTDTIRIGASPVIPDVPLEWQIVGMDDFNGDHGNDLVMRSTTTQAVEFWLLTGTTRENPPVPLQGIAAPGAEWRLAATVDFNGDGRPDLVWHDRQTRKLVVWTMNGTAYSGSIVPSPDQSIDSNWDVVAALDYNNDGWRDLLWYNSFSGKIVFWFLDGTLTRLAGRFSNPANAGDSNWHVVAGGDYGMGTIGSKAGPQGTRDILWRNESTGKLVIWFMDQAGNRVDGRFTFPTAPDQALDWSVVGPR